MSDHVRATSESSTLSTYLRREIVLPSISNLLLDIGDRTYVIAFFLIVTKGGELSSLAIKIWGAGKAGYLSSILVGGYLTSRYGSKPVILSALLAYTIIPVARSLRARSRRSTPVSTSGLLTETLSRLERPPLRCRSGPSSLATVTTPTPRPRGTFDLNKRSRTALPVGRAPSAAWRWTSLAS